MLAPDRLFVDTAYVLALINRRDQHHDSAVALSFEIDGTAFVTTDAVLLEIGNALSRSHRAEAAEVIGLFRGDPLVEVVGIDQPLFDAALGLYTARTDQTWGLVDCLSFVVMERRGLTAALTTDAHFTQAGFSVLLLD